MYSWIASWYPGSSTEEQQQLDQSLYVENNNTKTDDWTWIEVIPENHSDGMIYIQSSEQQRNQLITGPVIRESVTRKRKRRRELMAEKAFVNSLYIDYPLFVEPPLPKRLKRVKSVPLRLETICRKTLTISEVLSNTFPRNCLFPSNCLVALPQPREIDLCKLMQQAILLKALLEIAISTRREKSALDNGLEQWLFTITGKKSNQAKIEWKKREAIEWKKKQLAIEWNKYPAIGWKKNDDTGNIAEEIDDDEIQITEVRYPLPSWLSKIDVVERYNMLPGWISNIDPTLFDDTELCGHKSNIRVQPLDVIETNYSHNDTENESLPLWMRKIDDDLFDDEDNVDLQLVPSWMQHMNVCEQPRVDTNREKMKQWVKNLEDFKNGVSKESIRAKNWLTRLSHPEQWYNPQPLISKVNGICESLMGVAVIAAVCDVYSNTGSRGSSVLTEPESMVIKPRKRKNSSTLTPSETSKRTRKDTKKNRKWLKRANAVVRYQAKKQKHQPKIFSGRKGLRAC